MKRVVLTLVLGVVAVIALGCLAGAFVLLLAYLQFAPPIEVPEGATEAQRIDAIDQWFVELHERRWFNGVAMVMKDGQPIWTQALGVADPRTGAPLTNQSQMRLASLSKQFTAVGALVLSEQGRLDLDAPVSTVLPGFRYPGVTTRHLLTHTSGIEVDYMTLAEERRDEFGEFLTLQDVVTLYSSLTPKTHASPGEVNQYSNTDSVLAAAVIQTVSGNSFEAFMREEVFVPLGMTARIYNGVSTIPPGARMAIDIDIDDDNAMVLPTWLDGVAGDGAVFASLDDMVIWDQVWRDGGGLLPASVVQQAMVPTKLSTGETSNYGMGWVVEGHYVWHNGSWLGANTYLSRFEDPAYTVVVLDNASNLRQPMIAERIEEALFVR